MIRLVAMLAPRLALVGLWLWTGWIDRTFTGPLLPAIGTALLPYGTLAYIAAAWQNHGRLDDFWLILVAIALLVDVAHWGSVSLSAFKRRSRIV